MAVDLVHQPNIVETQLVPLANGALVVADESANGEEVIELGERLRPFQCVKSFSQ